MHSRPTLLITYRLPNPACYRAFSAQCIRRRPWKALGVCWHTLKGWRTAHLPCSPLITYLVSHAPAPHRVSSAMSVP